MPTFRITDPNSGRILQVTGDTPPTQEELTQLFAQFQVETVPEIDPIFANIASKQGPIDAALISAGRGLTNIARGLGLADPAGEAERLGFEALEEQRPISTTVGEIAGEAAPFLLPGGAIGKLATIPGRVAASGLLGAAEGGIIARGRGGDDLQTAQSAGLGGAVAGAAELAFPIIGRLGGKIFRNITGKSPTAPLITNGAPSRELLDALDTAGLSFDDLGAEAQRILDTGGVESAVQQGRKDFLESQGVSPTRAQITGEASDFQSQQELAKTSGKVRRAIQSQDEALSSRFDNAVTETGGSAVGSSSPVIDFVADRSIDLDKAISDAYTLARQVAPTEKVVKPVGLSNAIKDIAGSDRATGGLASAAADILRTRGVLGPKGLKVTGKIDAATAEEVRKDLNALHSSLSPFGKSKLADLKGALDVDVEKAVGKDVFKDARASKAKFEKDLNRAKVNKFDARKKNLVRDILENKVNPDRFLEDAVLSKSVRSDDLEQVKRFLQLDGDGPGVDAWNDLRAESMQRIRDTAIKEVAGEPALSRAGMEKALDMFGRDKLRVLFSPEERKFLNDMLKVSKVREPVRGTALGKGPSAQAIQGLSKAVNRIPLLNSVFGGAGELVASDIGGRAALRQPNLTPLQPTSPRLPLASAAAVPLLSTEQEQ